MNVAFYDYLKSLYSFITFLLHVNLRAKIPSMFLLLNVVNACEFVRETLVGGMYFAISLPKKGIIAFYIFSCSWEVLKSRCWRLSYCPFSCQFKKQSYILKNVVSEKTWESQILIASYTNYFELILQSGCYDQTLNQ